ncbi:MAG: hypothetical protein KBD83_07940 [Gammaproteobacteria bacterium]|nr:hypothetical protein [Gammaproteobacteria bacterium]
MMNILSTVISFTVSYFSWNVNSDRRFKGPLGEAFLNHSSVERFPMMARAISNLASDTPAPLIALQEVDDAVLPLLIAYLQSINLMIETVKYNPSQPMDNVFNFIFAYDPTVYHITKTEQLYYTLDGTTLSHEERRTLSKEELFKRHFDYELEKSSQLVWLEHIATDAPFLFINNHPGLTETHRLLVAQRLCDHLASIPSVNKILVGDFNQFKITPRGAPPQLLQEQIDIFRSNGFTWVSESLLSDESSIPFISFPYDIDHLLDEGDRAGIKRLIEDAAKAEKNSDDRSRKAQAIYQWYIDIIERKLIPLQSTYLDAAFMQGENIVSNWCKTRFFKIDGTDLVRPASNEAFEEVLRNDFKRSRSPAYISDHPAIQGEVTLTFPVSSTSMSCV